LSQLRRFSPSDDFLIRTFVAKLPIPGSKASMITQHNAPTL